ncbi:MAG: PAS domain-containing protein [Cyclobacteriaceae bacterium]
MDNQLKILILEDSPEDLDLIERELKRGSINFTSRVVKKKDEYEQALHEFRPDVILSDHSLPQFNSIEAMQIWKEYQAANNLTVPFILITGSVSEEFAVQSIKAGADDYILKDRLKRLPSSIQSALDKVRLEKEKRNFTAELISQSALMKEAEHLANFGSWKVDLLSGKHQWSDEAFRIFGFEPGEIDPDYEKFFRHVYPEDKDTLKHILNEAVDSLPFQECEYRIIDKDSNIKNLHSRILVKRDQHDHAYQLIGFTLDITEQKLQTKALETQNQKLMEIAWVQSHEVRAPLARIMGLVQLLSRYPEENIDLKDSLHHILQSANELDEIVRKIVRKTEDIV